MRNPQMIDWENNFSKKDLFELRLKGKVPQFGYISSSKRARFVQFLVANGFLAYRAAFQDLVKLANSADPKTKLRGVDHYVGLYSVEHTFKYEELGHGSPYRAKEHIATKGHRFATDRSHRLCDIGPGRDFHALGY